MIDPFKMPISEIVEKAKFVESMGSPFILLGSTDYVDFDNVMLDVVSEVKANVSLPVATHFPSGKNGGLPYVDGVDFVIAPAIFNSDSPQFLWKCLLETYRDLGVRSSENRSVPVPILSAAATFGIDEKSARYLNVQGLHQNETDAGRLAEFANRFGFQIVYLFSRHGAVEPSMVRSIRAKLADDIMIFVGGGVRVPQDIDDYVSAGADFVVFGTAGEVDDWRNVFSSLLGHTCEHNRVAYA
ncbi:geranylgeranylglyceryl/heptaprenylglyceryl phosphate synthase [Shimia ponticola]|uniref:geranylgeranylglyceryl/heptaprenylglyceryl phosphate synthase n=1 Tax=Shimia ponticola TaxID=2582893 RepID=UPI00164B3637|nr:geranylgeranylglyceryl/heptaprenylglyceryl phosphate synthase [Shimia ponticola]